jgi:diaminopimelate epimerase
MQEKTIEIIIADPAKNITIFVLSPVEDRAETAKRILADRSLGAEQVGFVIPPKSPEDLWRLEMMGGEFCGNAARSFGLWAARNAGLSGPAEVPIGISGLASPLGTRVHAEKGIAEVAIPGPYRQEVLDFQGQTLRAYRFDGITHVIAPIPPDEKTFFGIKKEFEKKFGQDKALGVMFYDQSKGFMVPGVYVYGTNSLIFESSCGSGSGALGIWLSEDLPAGEASWNIAQPGGCIETRVLKKQGLVREVFIGGRVTLSEPMRIGVK